MELLFGVSNFGKIEHAEITLSDFTLFVGDNNSGKTFVMQLLYGVLKELRNAKPVLKGIEGHGEKELTYGVEWLKNVETQMNDYLSKNKKKIIRGIFHKDIAIEQLYFHMVNMDEIYVCEVNECEYDEFSGDEEGVVKKVQGMDADIYIADVNVKSREKRSSILFGYRPDRESLKQILAGQIWKMILLLGNTENVAGRQKEDTLFLPASRTGLQLLSKYFFAERDRKAVYEIDNFDFDFGDEDGEDIKDVTDNELGLTMPIYDFLQFLLRYNRRAGLVQRNKNLLRFIERHLIDGQVKHVGDEIYYHPDGMPEEKEDIPVYLASSLVNEITPIIKALSGGKNYRYIFYYEVETCLHPLKQGEMARLIVRLVNSGRRMVVSTHSDTMAGKLNNLLLLSFSEDSEEERKEKLKKLGLSKEDLLSGAKVHVYQFVNRPDGSSYVEELKFQTMPYVGYDFKLFMRSLDELYHETDIILK